MKVLHKEDDEIWVIFSREEKIRIGDILNIDGIVTQVVDIEFANVPGILEHLLRKSLIPKQLVKEEVHPEVKSILDTLADHKMAITKIRGRIVDENNRKVFRQGLVEFTISRAKSEPVIMNQQELFKLLGLNFSHTNMANTLSTEPQKFDIMLEKLGINLITGKKGSGKSYFAKKLLLRLIERGVITIVFDLNAEYVNIMYSGKNEPNKYANNIHILTPRLKKAIFNEQPLTIPLNEISYDDFATILNIDQGQAMYNTLIKFWSNKRGERFDLDDLKEYVKNNVKNDSVRDALLSRIETAKALNLFGPADIGTTIHDLKGKGGGAIILNLSRLNKWEREIIVEVVLKRISTLCERNEINAISIFLEEAQLYASPERFTDLLTRMRHIGIFPTFITNDPTTLPDEVFSQLDNLIAFLFRNDDELRRLARTGKVDSKTLQALKNLQPRQCIAVGSITNEFPIFLEITPQEGVVMGGESRRLV